MSKRSDELLEKIGYKKNGSEVNAPKASRSRSDDLLDKIGYTRRTANNTRTHEEQERLYNSWVDRANSLSNRISSDYVSRKGKYQNPTDFQAYRDETYSEIDDLLSGAASSRDYYTHHRDKYASLYGEETLDQLLKAIDDSTDYLNAVRSDIGKEYDYWSQFDTEDNYNQYLSYQEEQERLSNYDLSAAQQRIDTLKATRDEVMSSTPAILRTGALGAGNMTDPKIAALDAEISALEQEYKKAENIQYLNRLEAYQERSDFARNSAAGASKRPDTDTWSLFSKNDGTDDLYDFINDIDGYRDFVKAASFGTGQAQEYGGYTEYEKMARDEIAMYNYLYETQGKGEADHYLEILMPSLNQRRFQEHQDYLSDLSYDSPVLMSIASVPANLAGGIVSGVDLIGQNINRAITGKPVDYHSLAQQAGASGEAIRGAAGEVISGSTNWEIGDTNVAEFVYTNAMSGLDSLAASMFGGAGAAGTILAGTAGSSAARDVAARGGTDDMALVGGLAAGTFEALFERWSIGNFQALKEVPVSGFKDIVKNIAKSIGVNASEELLTEAANIAFDAVAMGDISNWQLSVENYMAEGKTEADAKKQTAVDMGKQLLEALIGGGLMGFGFGGIGSASSAMENSRIGQGISEDGDIDALRLAALSMQDGSRSRAIAQALPEDGEIKNRQAGALFRAYVDDAAQGHISQGMQEARARQQAVMDAESILRQAAADVAAEADQSAPAAEQTIPFAVRNRASMKQTAQQAEQAATSASLGTLAVNTPSNTPGTAQAQSGPVATVQKASFNESGAEMDVAGVSSVDNGKLYVALDGGGVASVDDITFDDPRVDALYANAAAFDTQTAKAFISGYDGNADVGNYYSGFASIYGAARSGQTMQQAISNSLHANSLSFEAQQLAYNAGLNAGPSTDAKTPASSTPQATRTAAEERTAFPPRSTSSQQQPTQETRENGAGVVREFRSRIGSEQDKSLRVLDAVARAIGRKIHVVDSITRGPDGAPALNATDAKGSIIEGSTNAYFDEETNEYYISLGGVGQAYMYFALHESVHDIAKNNALGYENLERIVFGILESKSADIASMMDVQRRLYPNEDDAYLRQEIVANTVPAILTDKATADAFLERVMGADADTRTAFEKLLDSIRAFLHKTYDVLKGQKSWQQMELIKGDLDSIDRIREAYFAALEDMQGQDAEQEESGAPSSEPRGFAAEYDAWDGKDANKRFFVGKTPSSLKYVGVKDQEIVWDASKIIKIKQEHAAMTDETIKQVPSVIESPILVMESKTVPGRITMFGELSDANGAPVLVALELEPTKDHRLTMDVIKIASAYGKDSRPQKFIDDSRILFVEPDKKKTHTWLKLYKLRLPSSVKYGLNGRVSYKKPSVKSSVRDGGPGDARPTMKDSQDNALTQQQAEFFKDSKVRDESGNLLVMYHGTPYGGFSQFRSGTYFTQKEWLAETYHSPSASSIRGKYDPATNPMTYAVYLDMRKPFDTRNAKERRIFEKEYYQQYGMGTPLMESGLPDWFDGSDLMEFIEEKGYDYDGLILDEGGMGGYGEEVISRGLSYVIFDPAQAKSTDNKAPTSSPNMRFSMIDPVEETDDLIAVHNLTGDNLAGVMELGGFPMPSIAVLRASQGHERYGDISIIFGKDTINPGTNRQNKVYGGDAWTPSFPRIEFEVNAKEAAKIRKRVYSVAGGYATLHELGSINLDEDNLETDLNRYGGDAVRMFKDNAPMKYAYLRDTGAGYELPMKTETLGKYSGHENSVIQGVYEELGPDLLNELMEEGYARYKSDTELIERLLRIINATYGGKSNFKELGFSQYDNLLRDARKYARNGATIGEEIDYSAARSQIDALVPQAEYEAWLRELFGSIIKSRGIRNNADYFTPSGNRRSFAALHWAVTLDNIVKAMKGGISKGGGMFGGNSIFGLATKDYKSISDIKADVSRLRVANEDEYAEIKETYQQRLLEIADEIKPPSERNSFIALDNSVEALLDAVRRGKSKAGIARILNNEYKGYYNIQNDTAQKIHDLVRSIYEMPTEYFEAKPERAVGLDEIRMVVMPKGEYEDIRARLQQRNIPIEEYDPDAEGDRLRALNSEPARKLRFSLKDTAHVSSAALESEIARKDQMIADLKAQFKLTEGHKVSDKALEKLARRVLKEYSSGYSLPALQENLRTMFDYIANAEQPAWDDIVSMGAGMAKAIIKQSSELDTTMHEYYADARDYLRNTRISLSSTQRSEAAYTAGSYREYRQSLFGSVNLTNDGISLDSVWGELSEMHPELFDPDATEGEMIPALLNAVDAMKPVYRNPYGYDMDGAAYDLFLRLYDEYFDIPEVKTFADKKAAELARVKARYTNKIAEIRQESKERYDARLKALRKENVSQRREYSQKYKKLKDEEALLVRMVEGRARNEERQQRLKEVRALKEKIQRQYRALTDDRNERLLKQRARFREWKEADRAKRQEREEATRYRNSIAKTAATLREMLASPKLKEGKYVPDFLREPVLNILSALDFTGARGGEGRQLKWRASMESLYHEYENYILAHSDDPNTQQLAKNASRYMDVQLMLHDAFMPVFEEFLEKTKGIDALGALDSTALEQLDMLLKSVSANIRDINRLYKNKRFASAANAGDTGIAYANNTRQHKKWRFLNKIKDFASMDMLDSYSWGIRMGEAGESIIGELSDGLENSYSKVREASEFFSKLKQKLKVKDADIHSWTQAVNGIKLDSGKTIRMSTAQIMELYALYNRPQARQHILKGGIEIDDITPKTGKIVEQKGAYAVTERDIARIFQKITPKQRDMIDAMQRFMSTTVAGWGNETTQELYMIDMYREPKYWTIRASRSSINAQDPAQRRTFNAVMNSSFTKATNRFAGNPIAIGDAFQTFGDHVAGMAVYNGLAMPIDDAMKWLNYRQRDESGAIVPNANTKLAIDKVMGDAGYQYFTNLIQDLNGLSSSSYSTQLSAKLLSNFKRASVAGKLRVVVQQPTAVFRALSEIKGKYLLSAIVKKHSIKEMRENSPIAWWKSQGNYEIGTGRSLRSVIIGDDTGYQKMMDKAMKPAGAADDLTWSHIWEAVKLEVKAEHRGLTGQAYMEKVKERFSEIVNKTQVVDSIMHRSQAMRSQDVALKQATAFLSEPTKTYNMLSNAVYGVFNARGKNRGKALKRLAQVGAAWVLTQAVHAAVLATHDTFRDRDDEEEYWDAWLENYTANFIDGLNLFSSIPYVSQAVSLIQGYDASNMELEAIEAIVDAGNGWGDYFKGESKKTLYGLISSSVSALSYLTGAPFGGLMASAETLINAFAPGTIRKKQFTTTEGYEVLYSAITEGDTATRDRLREEFLADRIETIEKSEQEKIAAGEMPAYADSASIEAAAKLHMENNLSTVLANNPSIATAYNYRTAGDASSLRSLYRELEAMGFTTNEITKAINKYETAMNAEPGTQEAKHTAIYDRQNLFAAIRASVTSGDYEDIGIIRDELIATSNAVDPVASINSAVATEFKGEYLDYLEQGNDYMAERLGAVLESEFGHDQDDRDKWLKDAYKDSVATGDILSQAGYKDALLDRGFDQEAIDELYAAAQMKALAEEFYEAHPEYEDYSVNAVNKYQQYGEPLNIEANDFFNAWDFYSDAKALVDEDGNAISGSKKALVLAYIDKMALSITQKDALYYIFGYAESTIGDAPWH